MERPTLKQCYRMEILPPHTLFLVGEERYRTFSGKAFVAVAPLLDGTHTTEDMIRQLIRTVMPHDVMYALQQLERGGYLLDKQHALSAPQSAYWFALGINERDAQMRIAATPVQVHHVGTAASDGVSQMLESVGIRTTSTDAALHVVVTDDYTNPQLAAHNMSRLADGKPWLIAKIQGASIWLGPVIVPGHSACWECMAQRIRGNKQVETYVQQRLGRDMLPLHRASLPATRSLGASLVAMAVAEWIAAPDRAVHHTKLITLDTRTFARDEHAVVRRPQCPACGTVRAQQTHPPIMITSQPKLQFDGVQRTCSPESTVARLQHLISPITGVITTMQEYGIQHEGLIASYAAGHNFAMVTNDLSVLRTNLRSRSGGKGVNSIQAKASTIGEAIERYVGVYRAEEEPRLRATAAHLGDASIPLNDCLCFSEQQFAARAEWNRTLDAPYHLVPHPFDTTREIDWTPLWSLTEQRVRYLPTAYCYYGHPDIHQFFCTSDANGCAAGNTREEAIFQGFCELVERDAIAIWWYNRIRRPAVDVSTFQNAPYYERLREHYAAMNRDLWVLDLTTDIGLPVFVAVSAHRDHPTEDIILGGGAHLDPEIALTRALTEVNQFLPSVAQMNPDGTTRYLVSDRDTLRWFKTATCEANPYLLPATDLPATTRGALPTYQHTDVAQDVEQCVRMAQARGLDVMVLDQTRPDIDLAVCRVVVPGLRHFWRRLGPGRLYDVPVALGWMEQPLSEHELNPESLFF